MSLVFDEATFGRDHATFLKFPHLTQFLLNQLRVTGDAVVTMAEVITVEAMELATAYR